MSDIKFITLDMIPVLYIKALAKMGDHNGIKEVCDELVAHAQAPKNDEGHSEIIDWYTRKYPIENAGDRKIVWDRLASKLLVPDAPRAFVVQIHRGRPFVWDPRTLDILRMVNFLSDEGESDILLHFNPTYPPADRLIRSPANYALRLLADGLSLDPFDRDVHRAQVIRDQKILPPAEAEELLHSTLLSHDSAHRVKEKYGSK